MTQLKDISLLQLFRNQQFSAGEQNASTNLAQTNIESYQPKSKNIQYYFNFVNGIIFTD